MQKCNEVMYILCEWKSKPVLLSDGDALLPNPWEVSRPACPSNCKVVCCFRGGKGGGGVIDCVRRRLHWRGQGKLDFPVYSEGLLFSSGGNALTGVGGREKGT